LNIRDIRDILMDWIREKVYNYACTKEKIAGGCYQ
jgi:hypothetical protein